LHQKKLSEFLLQLRGVAAADHERFAVVLQINPIRAIKPAFQPLDAFEIDDRSAVKLTQTKFFVKKRSQIRTVSFDDGEKKSVSGTNPKLGGV
jgi:hypothetical protein